jgi:arginyl-tRNA synthetase
MKQEIRALLDEAVSSYCANNGIDSPEFSYTVEDSKNIEHGDIATNIALIIAKTAKSKPRDVADSLIKLIATSGNVAKVTIAGPGFINFFIAAAYYQQNLQKIVNKGQVVLPNIGLGKKINIEFVSSNPTGPLHVGHGRGAALGSAMASLLGAIGYDISSEYYINDCGTQMQVLALSVWLRYLELNDIKVAFPVKCYQGDYIKNIAAELEKSTFIEPYKGKIALLDKLFTNSEQLDDDQLLGSMCDLMANILPSKDYNIIHQHTLKSVLASIESDLEFFGVVYDNWFSESSLHSDGLLSEVEQKLSDNDSLYTEDGAVWFKSSSWGDDKNRVFKRQNGQYTYFAADLAYHWLKFNKGYDRIVDVFGSDHHSYIQRLKYGLVALGCDIKNFDIILVQFASLMRGKERISMSTRSGEFVTLRDLCAEVGVDAARYFYLAQKPQSHMDFDLEVAKDQSSSNPSYYVQYAHARICSIFMKEGLDLQNWNYNVADLSLLEDPCERSLMKLLADFQDVVVTAATSYAPAMLVSYLYNLASAFHSYYNAVPIITKDDNIKFMRLYLLQVTAMVLKRGLGLIEVSSPVKM